MGWLAALRTVADNDSCIPPGTPKQLLCEAVRENAGNCEGGGFIAYTETVYCHDVLLPVYVFAFILLLFFLFLGLSIAADSFFCPCLAVIVDQLKISQNIAGVTFLAFGNGAPDIFSSIASVLSTEKPKPGLAFGALMGAGIFLTTVVAAIVTLIRPFDVMRRPLMRDLIFFLGAAGWVFFILYNHQIQSWEAIGFICLYAIYAAVVIIGRIIRVKMRQRDAVAPSKDFKSSQIYYFSAPGVGASIAPGETRRGSNPERFEERIRRMDSVIEEGEWRYDVFQHGSIADRNMGQPVSSPLVEEEDEDTEDSFRDSTVNTPYDYVRELWLGIRPFSKSAWSVSGFAGKAFMILKAPVLVLLGTTIPVVNLDVEGHNWCKPLLMLQCLLSPLLIGVLVKKQSLLLGGVFPLWIALLLIGLGLACLLFFVCDLRTAPRYHKCLAYVGFVMAVMWIYGLAREVVGVVTMLGVVLGVSQDLLGLTLLAWSNSLGDLIADISVTRQGYPRMALSACIGGPLFNLLMGVGISFTIATIRGGGHGIPVAFTGVRLVLIFFLCWSIVSSMVLIPLSKFRANRIYAGYLLCVYVVFLTLAILTERQIIRFPFLVSP